MPDKIDAVVNKLAPAFEKMQTAIIEISMRLIRQEPTLEEIANFPMQQLIWENLGGAQLVQTVSAASGFVASSVNPNLNVAVGLLDEQFFINELGKAAANAKRVIANAFLNEYSEDALKSLLRNELSNLSEAKIGSLLNTAIRTTERTAYAELINDLPNETWFEYVGPEDEKNRPFCAKWVNQRIRKRDLEGLLNDYGEPAITAAGGYNCRHQWELVNE